MLSTVFAVNDDADDLPSVSSFTGAVVRPQR